jgi:ribonucleotide reductase beta subunit family protein with ferritin-like domain
MLDLIEGMPSQSLAIQKMVPEVFTEKALSESSDSSEAVSEKMEDFSRYSYFPIQYPSLDKFYQDQKNVFWTPAEIDYSKDRRDWDLLDDDTRNFIKFILFFFAQADGIVNENLIENFKRETSCIKEARNFYAMQECIEVIHNETYSMLIETFIREPEEKKKGFNAIAHYPSIKKLADWAFEWMDSSIPLLERIIAFACLEGIFFSSAFAAVYWIKRRNTLASLCKANEFIARDEGIHTRFPTELYKILTSGEFKMATQQWKDGIVRRVPGDGSQPLLRVNEHRVHAIIRSATCVQEEFLRDALRVDLIGMSADDMMEYVKCTADTVANLFGYSRIFHSSNPFEWMNIIGLPNKANFFETEVSEYSRAKNESRKEFDLEADF